MVRPPKHLVDTILILTGRTPVPDGLAWPHRQLFERVRAVVLSADTVTGVGVGEKEASGRVTGERGIVFFVREKLPATDVRADQLIPPVIIAPNGRPVFTDVRRSGRIVSHVNARVRPISSGFSTGTKSGEPGTLSGIVRAGNVRYLMSAKHVLTSNGTASAGEAIYFPSPADAGEVPAVRIGSLLQFQPFDEGDGYPNFVDAALAAVDPGAASGLDPAIPGATSPTRVKDPEVGMAVRLSGRSSNGARSTISIYPASFRAYYDPIGYIGFHGQACCPAYAEPGDSGALVVEAASGAVVGLHIAGSDEFSYFTPIRSVLSALGVTF